MVFNLPSKEMEILAQANKVVTTYVLCSQKYHLPHNPRVRDTPKLFQ